MDTTKLQAFCTVAELRNFSEAARRLNYTQPAISAQIRELENELKVVLFRKAGKKVELSEAGTAILPFAEKLLKNFQEFRGALPEPGKPESPVVRIGASSLPGVHVVPGLMEKAKELYPSMAFSLSINNNYQIERMLYANQIDAGFAGRKRMHAAQGTLTEHLLFKDDLVAVFPRSHALALREDIWIQELAGLPLILPPRNILTRRQVEERFHHLNLSFDMALEIGNTEAIKHLVEHGIGITILCRSAVKKEADAGSLCPVPVVGLDLSRYFCLLTLQKQARTQAASNFIEFIRDQFSENRAFPNYL